MTAPSTLPLFLLWVIGISLSGVMMPGPVTAIVISKGTQSRWAGAMVAIGHGLIEFPIIAVIYFIYAGFSEFVNRESVQITLGLAGGLVLIWMAIGAFRAKPMSTQAKYDNPNRSAILAGAAMTALSPFFLLWWATTGAKIISEAQHFKGGVAATGMVHWLCDAGWLLLLSFVVFKSKRLWTPKTHRVILAICGLMLSGFGSYFIYKSVTLAITA